MHTKLAQTTLLWASHGPRLHQLANAFRDLPIDATNHYVGFPPNHTAKLGGTWYLNESNSPGIQKRDHLVQTMARRVHRDDRERHLVLLRTFTNLFHSHDRTPTAHAE